jgi:hypothetical protein
MKQIEAQQIANRVARLMQASPPRVTLKNVRTSGWSGRYDPKTKVVHLSFGPNVNENLKRALVAHEVSHWGSRVVYCGDERGYSRVCMYRGEHDRRFYNVLNKVHKHLGTKRSAARELESRAGYHPPDGWLDHSRSYQTSSRRTKKKPLRITRAELTLLKIMLEMR